MERTYNDIVAENKRLQDSLDVMIDKNAELVFREKALKTENDFLKKENAFIIGQLDFLRAMYGLPTYEEEKANKTKAPICKVISMNQ